MVQVKLELVHPVFVLMISGLRKPLKSFKHEIKRSVSSLNNCEKIHCCCLSHPVYIFCKAALANQYMRNK